MLAVASHIREFRKDAINSYTTEIVELRRENTELKSQIHNLRIDLMEAKNKKKSFFDLLRSGTDPL